MSIPQNVNNNYFWVMNDHWFLFYLYTFKHLPQIPAKFACIKFIIKKGSYYKKIKAMWILKRERNNLRTWLHESQDSQNGMVSTRCHKGKKGCCNYCFPDQDSQTLPFLGKWFLIPLYDKQGSSSYCSFSEQSWPQSSLGERIGLYP